MDGCAAAGPSSLPRAKSSARRSPSSKSKSSSKRRNAARATPCLLCLVAVAALSSSLVSASAAVLPRLNNLRSDGLRSDAGHLEGVVNKIQWTVPDEDLALGDQTQVRWRAAVGGSGSERDREHDQFRAALVGAGAGAGAARHSVSFIDVLDPTRTAAAVVATNEVGDQADLHNLHRRAAPLMTAPAAAKKRAKPSALAQRAPEPTTTTSTSSSASATTTTAISTSTVVPSNYTLPQAFDTTLGTNFTSTACPSFFRTFLANPTFISCTPFSFLIGTSNAFFAAERAPYSLLPYVLDASCAAPLDTCTTLMNQLAVQLAKTGNCGNDLARRNPLVLEALEGFQNYPMLYQAGCQRNNATGRYCFADANIATNPSELYYYYLPEGTSLPSGTTPKCGTCTQGLLQIYSQYATNTSYAISQTYGNARTVTAVTCGPNFAPLVAVSTTSGAMTRQAASTAFIAFTLVSSMLFLLS